LRDGSRKASPKLRQTVLPLTEQFPLGTSVWLPCENASRFAFAVIVPFGRNFKRPLQAREADLAQLLLPKKPGGFEVSAIVLPKCLPGDHRSGGNNGII